MVYGDQMKDEVEKLRREIMGLATKAITCHNDFELVFNEEDFDNLLTLFQTAQVKAVRAELEKLLQVGRDPGFDIRAQRLPIDNIRIYLTDRLAELKEDGETK